jgi:hypothetical protein
MHVCMYACVYVCMYVCMCVCVCMYTYPGSLFLLMYMQASNALNGLCAYYQQLFVGCLSTSTVAPQDAVLSIEGIVNSNNKLGFMQNDWFQSSNYIAIVLEAVIKVYICIYIYITPSCQSTYVRHS